MAIEITGAPEPIQSPRFAGVTLRVPLTEQPSAAWLDVLVAQEKLPGKGHRVEGAALEIHLGHGDRDVKKALRNLDAAITFTNSKYEAEHELLEQHSRGPAAREEAAIVKFKAVCDEWWDAKSDASANADRVEELPPAASTS